MVPKRVDVGLFEAGECKIKIECLLVDVLLGFCQVAAGLAAIVLNALEERLKILTYLLPFLLVEHRNVLLTTPAINGLRHSIRRLSALRIAAAGAEVAAFLADEAG
jgi:hypothetical protein